MKILFDLGHPAHFHLFINAIFKLKKREHDVIISVRERENSVKVLLNKQNLNYFELYPNAKGFVNKALVLIKNDLKFLKSSKKLKLDAIVSVTSPYSAHVSAILGKPHITFADTEDAGLILTLTIPFTDVIITENSYTGKLPEKKHVSVPTWRPLAYLHPKYFKPDEGVLKYLDVKKGEKYFIVRFSAWDASHDWKLKVGISWEDRNRFVKKLAEYGRVFISSEEDFMGKIEYGEELKVPPQMFHDALAFSSGYLGEGHISAREAVCFGIPSILISPRAKLESVIMDLVNKKYIRLFHSYKEIVNEDFDGILISQKDKVQKEIRRLVDLTGFFVYFIENYPHSFEEYQEDREELMNKFKFDKEM